MRAANPDYTDEEPIVTIIRNSGPYIAFAEGISLPTYPPPPLGFVIKDLSKDEERQQDNWLIGLEKEEAWPVEAGTIQAMRDIFEAMERLYEWALSLPDFKN
jgi:hypothetical protein